MAFQRLRVLFAMVVRETGTKFGRSYGGYLWAIAEPLGGILMLTLVASASARVIYALPLMVPLAPAIAAPRAGGSRSSPLARSS